MKISASSQLAFLRENLLSFAETCTPLWHPLGFVSCEILNDPGNIIVRVHYWPKGERRTKNPDWPIHTHVYDLSSLVLMGRVRDQQFREKQGSEYAVFSVSYSGENSAISWTGRNVAAELLVDEYHAAGEEYTVSVGTFHQTHVPQEETAATLVVQSNFQHSDPLVLGQASDQKYPYDRLPFDREQFWTSVSKATQLLG